MIKKHFWRLAAAAGLVAAAAAMLTAYFAERGLARLAPGGLGVAFSTRIYSAPHELRSGAPADLPGLLERLARLDYRETRLPAAPGEYRRQGAAVEVYLRGFRSPLAAQQPLAAVVTDKGGAWEIRDSSGGAPGAALLEPELAEELSGPLRVRRDPATLDELPVELRDAVIAVEDKRFYSHFGLDLRATARSLLYTLTRRGLWGGSTITQQLAKNLFLTPRRTLKRKAAEAALAFYLELRFTKDEILTLYLNHIYLGQDGPSGVAGMKAAARFYFGRDPAALSLSECAALAGLIRSPYLYNPRRDPAAALRRRDHVLARMRAEGMITPWELAEAAAAPLEPVTLPARPDDRGAAYYAAEVVRRLLQRYDEDEIFRGGLTIYTSMDPLLQAAAARAAAAGRYEAAVLALDPAGGGVLAIAGGRDYRKSQFNRATQARRQPGSAFKPFVYGAALEAGFTPATLLQDTTRSYQNPGGETWEPRNYNGVYAGTVTLRAALARSLNLATLDLAGRVGPAKITAYARRLGIDSPLESSLAVALGASEVGLLELTAAYAPFANGGFRITPVIITAVTDQRGRVLEYADRSRVPVITPAQAYLMTSLLESAVTEGTGSALGRYYGWIGAAAGKTGTTNKGRDAWFVGYTPRLLAGVWIGDDSNKAVGAVGAGDAAPLWTAFMRASLGGVQPDKFEPPPEGLVTVKVDPMSGLLAVAGCPAQRKEVFAAGTEPKEKCPLHPRGIGGWFKRFFGIGKADKKDRKE